jgi:hypothetical protein
VTRTAVATAGRCRDCRFFLGDAAALERAIRGLSILSSAYGAVRGDTGLCRRSDEFVTASGSCNAFERVLGR